MSPEIDHIVFCVPDLDEAGDYLARRYGFVSHPGGRHPGHGTANRIVPLRESYLELVAVVDAAEAAQSGFGSWVGENATYPPDAHALCLRTRALDDICERLGLEAIAMTRETPHGVTLSWRLAGLEEALAQRVPFFVEWDIPPEAHPGRMEPGNPARIDEVVLTGDVDVLREWASGSSRVRVEPGEPGIDWVGFAPS